MVEQGRGRHIVTTLAFGYPPSFSLVSRARLQCSELPEAGDTRIDPCLRYVWNSEVESDHPLSGSGRLPFGSVLMFSSASTDY